MTTRTPTTHSPPAGPTMPGYFDYHWESLWLRTDWHGDLDLDDLLGLIQVMHAHEAEHPEGFHRLHVLSDAGEIRIDFNTIMHVAANRRSYNDSLQRDFRAAFVATQPAHLGLVRMYQTMMESTGVDVQCFSSLGEAEAWLLTAEDAEGAGNPPGSPLQ